MDWSIQGKVLQKRLDENSMTDLQKDYVITVVKWLLDQNIIIANEFGSWLETHRTLEEVRPPFWYITKFLQDNNLTTHTLAKTPEDIDENLKLG